MLGELCSSAWSSCLTGIDSARFDNCVSVLEFECTQLCTVSNAVTSAVRAHSILMGVISPFPSPYDSDMAVGTVDLELVSLLWCRTGFIVKFAMLSANCGEVELGVLLSPCCSAYMVSPLRNEFSCLCKLLEFKAVRLGVLVRLSSLC